MAPHIQPPLSEVLHFLLAQSLACLASAAASFAAVLLALAAAEEAFVAAAEVWQQGFFPGPAAAAGVTLSVHLAAGLESPGVALELVQLELAGASVLYLEQELASGALASA